MTKSNAPVEHHSSECILEPWVSETVLSPSASPLSRTCQGLCCVALNPPPFPPRATAGRVIGAASQQQRALFYPLPPYLLSYTPPYYPLLPAILSTASNLIHLIKLADPGGSKPTLSAPTHNCLSTLSIGSTFHSNISVNIPSQCWLLTDAVWRTKTKISLGLLHILKL